MANQKISELSAITVIDDADVLPIVDGSALQTKKISVTQVKSLAPVQSVNGSTGAVTVQETLVSGTNIKTINSQSLLGSGDITISGGTTNWGDIGGTLSSQTDLQSALDAKQATLVSGTNIKTINSTSILGSGDITISGSVAWGGITGTLSSQTDLQSALDGKEATITAGTTAQYYRGDKTFQTLDKAAVGLSNVDNTSDLNKPISTATQSALDAKEPTITAGTTSQYYRGDKSFQTLDKTAVGLSNVDNTSDLNKPISTATQTALDAKQATITGAATTIDTEDLTASRALVSDGSGKVAVSSVTSTELGYVSGVTSAVQTQINSKISTYDGVTYDVTALAAVTQAEYDAIGTKSATTLYFII